ncbi:MAG TPA: MoxR family ATPase [Clostridiales bacterium]|jgi:MoxR-like ATPase|nr:MoxR family ATPase [Clostridiales bacterium]
MNKETDKTNAGFDAVAAHAKVISVINEIEKVIVGKRPEVILLMTALLSGSHVLIEDVPGTGKTSLAASLAKATGLDFKRAQFTPDVMASDITGFNIYNRQKESFEFREGLVMCNLLLADEVNRASPKTQSALLEAMEENRVTVDGVTYQIPDPFMVIATQNPTGYVGTYPLPEAQLDRFALKIRMGYPSAEEEIDIIKARRGVNPLDRVDEIIGIEEIRQIRRHISDIRIDDELYGYIVALVTSTRKHPQLALGASPRASVALMHLSQAYAFIRGREYVLPDDIGALFRPAIGHRLMLRQEAKLSNQSADTILGEILRTTDVPYKGKR